MRTPNENEAGQPVRTRSVLACVALAALVFGVYWRVAQHAFVEYDTPEYVTENPHVLAGLSLAGARWALTSTYAANWFPLTWLSHMLDVELFGVDAGRHHLMNVALHAASACVLFLALQRMTKALLASFLVAALFAIHPLHVESVAWIVERKDVLSALFGWLCLYAWCAYAERPSALRYGAAWLCLAAGLMSKPMLVTWPFVLLLVDVWPLRRTGLGWRRLVLEKLPFLALSIASSLMTLYVQRLGGAVQALDNLPLTDRLSNAAVAVARYLAKTFWPVDLAFYYPRSDVGASTPAVLGAIALVIALLVAAVLARRRALAVTVGVLFFLGTLVPVIGIVQVGGQALADRYTYIPLTGVFVVLAFGAAQLFPSLAKPRVALGALALVPLVILAARQVSTWRDTRTLARHALAATGENHVARNLLAIDALRRGEVDAALGELRRAHAVAPREPDVLTNLAAALFQKGALAEAEVRARECIAIAPERPKIHSTLAGILIGGRRFDEALVALDHALALDPALASAHNNRAIVLDALGRTDEAITAYERAIALRPDLASAYLGLARSLAARRRPADALRALEACLRLRPDWPPALVDAAWLLATDATVANTTRAIEFGERAVQRTNGRSAEAFDALARAYAAAGRFPDAVNAAQHGAARAKETGDDALAQRIARRIAAFERGEIDRTTPR
ncbi:MAG: tetratricopeptide repeat protein [Planctomycetota bacterium]